MAQRFGQKLRLPEKFQTEQNRKRDTSTTVKSKTIISFKLKYRNFILYFHPIVRLLVVVQATL